MNSDQDNESSEEEHSNPSNAHSGDGVEQDSSPKGDDETIAMGTSPEVYTAEVVENQAAQSEPDGAEALSAAELSSAADTSAADDQDNLGSAENSSDIVDAALAPGIQQRPYPAYDPALVAQPGIAALRVPPTLAQSGLDNMAAKGGAYGSFVLGIWSVLGSLFSPWAAINGILGLLLGVWGLTSHHQKVSWIGIILSLAGLIMSAIGVSDTLQNLFPVDETNRDL